MFIFCFSSVSDVSGTCLVSNFMYQPLTDRAADSTHIKPVPGLIVSFVLVMIIWKTYGVSGLPSVPSGVMAS